MKIIISLFMTVILTGCVSTRGGLDKPNDTLLIHPQASFGSYMSANDQAKLLSLVSTAKADETTLLNGDETYEFTSLRIFINSKGQACREYKLRALYGFRNESLQTACRNGEGVWKLN